MVLYSLVVRAAREHHNRNGAHSAFNFHLSLSAPAATYSSSRSRVRQILGCSDSRFSPHRSSGQSLCVARFHPHQPVHQSSPPSSRVISRCPARACSRSSSAARSPSPSTWRQDECVLAVARGGWATGGAARPRGGAGSGTEINLRQARQELGRASYRQRARVLETEFAVIGVVRCVNDRSRARRRMRI
jgi:hypothetical protein